MEKKEKKRKVKKRKIFCRMCIASVQRRGRGEWDRTPHEKYDHITREKTPYVQWLLSGMKEGRREVR